jgi:RecJ-like exonuclease
MKDRFVRCAACKDGYVLTKEIERCLVCEGTGVVDAYPPKRSDENKLLTISLTPNKDPL